MNKPGRPKKIGKKTEIIALAVSPENKQIIENAAKSAGLSVSTFVFNLIKNKIKLSEN